MGFRAVKNHNGSPFFHRFADAADFMDYSADADFANFDWTIPAPSRR